MPESELSLPPREFIVTGLAVITTILAIYGIWTATESKIYGEESVEIAMWTSWKDFLEYCESDDFLAPGCEDAKGEHISPPPRISDRGKTSTLSIVLLSAFALLLCLLIFAYLVKRWRQLSSATVTAANSDIAMTPIDSQPDPWDSDPTTNQTSNQSSSRDQLQLHGGPFVYRGHEGFWDHTGYPYLSTNQTGNERGPQYETWLPVRDEYIGPHYGSSIDFYDRSSTYQRTTDVEWHDGMSNDRLEDVRQSPVTPHDKRRKKGRKKNAG